MSPDTKRRLDLRDIITRSGRRFFDVRMFGTIDGPPDPSWLASQIQPLVHEGLLVPTKSAHVLIDGDPPVYSKYRVIDPGSPVHQTDARTARQSPARSRGTA
jgi:hypothetical protein